MATKIGNGLDLQGSQIRHLADGSANDDAATYGQLQAFLAGLAWKQEVRAAATGTISLAAPGASIDGVALANGDRVLLKNQATASENGVYNWHGATSALTRANDYDSTAEVRTGVATFVTEGTANFDTAWVVSTAGPITVGTTPIGYAQFGGGMAYSATNGVQLISGAFSVKLPGGSWLVADATGLSIDRTKVPGKFAATIGDGAATTLDVVHNLGTKDITWTLRDSTTDEGLLTDWKPVDANTLRFTFATAPATASLRAVVHG